MMKNQRLSVLPDSDIEKILHELGFEWLSDKLTLTFCPCEEPGLTVEKDGKNCKIVYSSRTELIRALGLVAEHASEPSVCLSQKKVFDTLTLMVDQSRNAVLNLESAKKLIRISALMGYTGLMLYTEDTYALEEYPYFGYMRGRFSAEELKTIDDYAALFGMELIPCIQTLAHLDTVFRWQEFAPIHDAGDALLCDEEKTYELIESMLKNLSGCVRSRKINIGMDEARMVGRGTHYDRFGAEPRCEIMLRHLDRVAALCRKYGYRPMMWSDIISKTNLDENKQIRPDLVARLPEDVQLVYWTYEATDRKVYDTVFDKHRVLKGHSLGFAGSTSGWFGWAPLNQFALTVLKAALPSVREHGIKDVILTVWGDNGADASLFASLTTMQHYAEFAWTGEICEAAVEKRLSTCAGADYTSFMEMERLCDLPGRADFGYSNINPYRYMFYQDILSGLFDRHVPEGSDAHFAKCAEQMRCYKENSPQWAYLFETLETLCRVLSVKAELGVRLCRAYQQKDTDTLCRIAETELPQLCGYLDAFHRCYRTQWMQDNKPFGFEVQDIRIAGVKARAEDAAQTLTDYLNGNIQKIEQLETERLYYDCRGEDSNRPILRHAVNWNCNVSPSLI